MSRLPIKFDAPQARVFSPEILQQISLQAVRGEQAAAYEGLAKSQNDTPHTVSMGLGLGGPSLNLNAPLFDAQGNLQLTPELRKILMISGGLLLLYLLLRK